MASRNGNIHCSIHISCRSIHPPVRSFVLRAKVHPCTSVTSSFPSYIASAPSLLLLSFLPPPNECIYFLPQKCILHSTQFPPPFFLHPFFHGEQGRVDKNILAVGTKDEIFHSHRDWIKLNIWRQSEYSAVDKYTNSRQYTILTKLCRMFFVNFLFRSYAYSCIWYNIRSTIIVWVTDASWISLLHGSATGKIQSKLASQPQYIEAEETNISNNTHILYSARPLSLSLRCI